MKNKKKAAPQIAVNVPITEQVKAELIAAAELAGDMPIAAMARIFIAQGIARWRATGKLELMVAG
jgi:hypothetical protein